MNFDCHLANILSKRNSIKTLQIDFGRIVDFYGKRKSEDAFPEDGDEIIRKYNLISGNDYDNELREVMSIEFDNLYVSRGNTEDMVMEKMNRIFRFLAYVDYVVNTTYYNMNGKKRPQMNQQLKCVYGSSNMSDFWDSNESDYKQPSFVLDHRSIPAFKDVIKKFAELTLANTMATYIVNSASAIEKSTMQNRFFNINKRESYDRSSLFSVIHHPPPPPQRRNSRSPSKARNLTKVIEKEEGYSVEQKILIIVVVGFILKKMLSGGSRRRLSQRRGGNSSDQVKIIKIVTEKLKEYNCGIDFDLSKDEIKPITEDELNEYIATDKIEIINPEDSKDSKDTCDLETLKIPPIKYLLKHVKKQLAVNKQIMSLRKTRRSSSKSSSE
jgi:hypothetical protein